MALGDRDFKPAYLNHRQSLSTCSARQRLLRLRHAAPSLPAPHLRGYDKRWSRIHNAVLTAEPLCRHCAKAGRSTPAVLVDYIVPLPSGNHDREYLQSLCSKCYAKKTAKERTQEGLPPWKTARWRLGVGGRFWRAQLGLKSLRDDKLSLGNCVLGQSK